MKLEKYKDQMSERFPSARFTEETLLNLKNGRARLRLPLKAIGKGAAAAALLSAAAVAVFAGAGLFRSAFGADGGPEQTFSVLVDEDEYPELAEMTPLANPDHAIKIETENGTIALTEDAACEDILAADAVLSEGYGIVGYRRVCELFRALRAGEEYSLILAKLPNAEFPQENRTYQAINLNADGTVNGKFYLYEKEKEYLQIFPFGHASQSYSNGVGIGYTQICGAYGTPHSAFDFPIGMSLDPSVSSFYSIGTTGLITVPSITDLLDATGFSDEAVIERYLIAADRLSDLPGINVLYRGAYSSPDQLPLFLALAERGNVRYCSTTVLSLEPLSEPDGGEETARGGECFYALEYLNGRYRIFTMKNGFEGEFDEQLFDGYTVADDTLIFENGSVTYRFPYEKKSFPDPKRSYGKYLNAAAEMLNFGYGSNNPVLRKYAGERELPAGIAKDLERVIGLGCVGYQYRSAPGVTKQGFQKLLIDPFYWEELNSDLPAIFRIDEEYSDTARYAVEVESFEETLYYGYEEITDEYGMVSLSATVVPAVEIRAAASEASGGYRLSGGVQLTLYKDDCELRETPDGRTLLMLSREEWEALEWRSDETWKVGDVVFYTLRAEPGIK